MWWSYSGGRLSECRPGICYVLRNFFSFPESINEYTKIGHDYFFIIYNSPSVLTLSVDITLLINYPIEESKKYKNEFFSVS